MWVLNGYWSKGSMAERSKALVQGISLYGGVGSNPNAAIKHVDTFFIEQPPAN